MYFFNGWVILHCVYVPQLSYPFISWWTSRLLPCPGYYKQCCDEHWGTHISFNSGFLGVYAQQWDCWVVWQFRLGISVIQIMIPLTYIFQFSSVAQSYPTLCHPVNCSNPGFPVHHQLPKLTQTHAHWVGDAIQPSHPLSSPSPPAFNLSQHQGLFRWVSPSHQVAKILEFQLQHQSFQRIFGTDLL